MIMLRRTGVLLLLICMAAGLQSVLAGAAHAADVVANPPFDVQAATDAYLRSLPAADKLKSDSYFEGGYWLILWNALYGIVVSLVLLASGASRQVARCCVRDRTPALAGKFHIWRVSTSSSWRCCPCPSISTRDFSASISTACRTRAWRHGQAIR